jgi:hypothetical protein
MNHEAPTASPSGEYGPFEAISTVVALQAIGVAGHSKSRIWLAPEIMLASDLQRYCWQLPGWSYTYTGGCVCIT